MITKKLLIKPLIDYKLNYAINLFYSLSNIYPPICVESLN